MSISTILEGLRAFDVAIAKYDETSKAIAAKASSPEVPEDIRAMAKDVLARIERVKRWAQATRSLVLRGDGRALPMATRVVEELREIESDLQLATQAALTPRVRE